MIAMEIMPMLRRLTLCLGLLALAASASAQTRIAGSDSSGAIAPVTVLNGGLVTHNGTPSHAIVNQTSATTTEVVALTSGQAIHISGFILTNVGVITTPATIKFVYGTGANCASGTTDLTPVFTGSLTAGDISVFSYGNGSAFVLKVPVSNALCVTSTTTQAQRGVVTYQKF
jgi:hypothetical protein